MGETREQIRAMVSAYLVEQYSGAPGGQDTRAGLSALAARDLEGLLAVCEEDLRSNEDFSRLRAAHLLGQLGQAARRLLPALRAARERGGEVELSFGFDGGWGYADKDVRSVSVGDTIDGAIVAIEASTLRLGNL